MTTWAKGWVKKDLVSNISHMNVTCKHQRKINFNITAYNGVNENLKKKKIVSKVSVFVFLFQFTSDLQSSSSWILLPPSFLPFPLPFSSEWLSSNSISLPLHKARCILSHWDETRKPAGQVTAFGIAPILVIWDLHEDQAEHLLHTWGIERGSSRSSPCLFFGYTVNLWEC